MAYTYQRTVTVSPIDDQYTWTRVDNATNQTANWINITNVQQNGQDTDTWNIEVLDNSSSSQRSAVVQVNHSNGVTTDSFTITQVGVQQTSSPGPAPAGWNVTTSPASSIFSTGFTMEAAALTHPNLGSGGWNGSPDNPTERGFEWGTDQNNLSNTQVHPLVGIMAFDHDLTGLNAETTYYYRAYIITPAEGTVYGSIESAQTSQAQLTFTEFGTYLGTSAPTTPGSTVDENPFPQRIFFKIAASQDLAGHTIEVLSLTKLAPTPGAGEIEDFSISNSTMLNGSTINDLVDFEFGVQGATNNEARLSLAIANDNRTEGNETYRVTISPDYKDANGNVVGQHGLAETKDFIINDTSVYTPTLIGYGLSPFNALGSPTASNSGGITLSTYTFDNSGGTFGPGHQILINAFDNLDPAMETINTNTPNTFYWSNNADGSTNDTNSINGSGSNAVIHNLAIDTSSTSGSGTGWLNNHAKITFEDGPASTSSPIGLIPNVN